MRPNRENVSSIWHNFVSVVFRTKVKYRKWIAISLHSLFLFPQISRFPVPESYPRRRYEDMRHIWAEGVLQRRRREGGNYVHFGDTVVLADHFESGALSDVPVGQLCAHSRPREIPRIAGNPEFKWHGIQCSVKGTILSRDTNRIDAHTTFSLATNQPAARFLTRNFDDVTL